MKKGLPGKIHRQLLCPAWLSLLAFSPGKDDDHPCDPMTAALTTVSSTTGTRELYIVVIE